jgi:hypothetical protein
MKKAVFLVLAVAVAGLGAPALAVDVRSGPIVVSDVWARATVTPAMKTGAAFGVLANEGSEMDRLVAAQSPVAERVELHTHAMDGGIMKMRQVEAIEVHPGTPTVLQPGGLHVMFIGLRAPLQQGSAIPLTLVFEKAGRIAITADVLAPGAMGKGLHAPMPGMGHQPGG